MKLKLVVRYNQFVIHTLDLEPGNYDIGRGSENDININHPSIRRKHGKLSFAGGAWTYQEYASPTIIRLTDREPIQLSDEIDIATEDYTLIETTQVNARHPFRTRENKRDKILYGFLIGLGLVAGTLATYFVLQSQFHRADPNLLLSQVRSKVVEFEKKRDPGAIDDYKKMGGLTDADFRDNVGFCTGFLVASNVVLTASHCLWGSDFLDIQTDFEVRTSDGKKFTPQRVLGFDPIRDFLFLEVPGMESYGHLEFASDYKIGQTVYTLGNAHGQGIAIREGIMASETADENDPTVTYIRFSAGASPGNSGGPLIDQKGRIVALVFAATGAENYNLGTSAKDLSAGFKKFVVDRSPKEVKFTLKKLFNFNMTQFLQKQGLPFLPEYNEFPETVQKVGNVQFTFKVPVDFDKVTKQMLDEIQDKSSKAVEDLVAALLAKKEVVLDWSSFAGPETPAIHPSQFDRSQNSFYLYKGRYYMKVAGFLDSPNRKDFKAYVDQFEKEKKFDFQAYGMNTDLIPPTASDPTLLYLPRDKSKTKTTIEDLAQGVLYSQMTLRQKIDDPDTVKKFIHNYLMDGVLASIYSPFVRPQSYKNFTLHDIDKPTDHALVQDGRGRNWQRYHLKIFEQIHFYIYCLPQPEAVECVARVIPVDEPYRLELLEANFRKYILAHFLENPYFWEPETLADFMAKPAARGLTSLQGATLKKHPGGYTLNLQAFKVNLELPAAMQSLRVQTGLFYGKDKKAQWTGYGAEWVEPGAQAKVCGLGVEPVGSQSVFILNTIRDALKREKYGDLQEKQKDIPKVWTEKARTAAGDELQVFGYCAPLRDNPDEVGYYVAAFNKARPRPGIFKVLK